MFTHIVMFSLVWLDRMWTMFSWKSEDKRLETIKVAFNMFLLFVWFLFFTFGFPHKRAFEIIILTFDSQISAEQEIDNVWYSACQKKVLYKHMHIISDKTFLVNNKSQASQDRTSKSQHTSKCYKMLYYKIVNNASAKCCAEPLCVIVFYWKETSSGLHSAWINLKVTATPSILIQRGIVIQLHLAQRIMKVKKQDQLHTSFTRHIWWYQTLGDSFAATISPHFKVKVNNSCHRQKKVRQIRMSAAAAGGAVTTTSLKCAI